MEFEIIDQPIRYRLHGFSSAVENHCYGEVGCRLMDRMWQVAKQAGIKTTGINHWVYLTGNRMFVGVEVPDAESAGIDGPLEPFECELERYAKHLHVGPYQQLPEKWRSLRAELSARGETVTMPSLEIYGHSCEGADESQAETTIVLRLGPKST